MYPITEEARALFEKKQRQTVEVKVELKDGSTADDFSITEADIVLGSFSIDRYCTSGKNIEIGSAIASELKFTLDNSRGKFDNVTLGGAKLFVRLGIKDWSISEAAMNYVDCGYFTVDEEPRPLTQISVAALDNMMRFDRPVNWDEIIFPITPKALLDISCDACDVTLSTECDFSALPNSSYEIKARPSTTDITYRQLIQWIAELTGTCAFIDWSGHLRFQWFENTPVAINPSNRYSSVVNDPITITGVQITQDENTVHLYGEEEYVFNIEGNELIQDNHLEITRNLGVVLCGFSYVPFECSCFPMPYLYPLDIVSFTDIKGNVFNTMVTAHVYTLNGASNMKAVGETRQQKGYLTSNPFTKRESLIIKQIQKYNNTNLNRVEQETLDLNKALVNALGLYNTAVKHDDGSVTYYYHSKPTLEECADGDVIFCLNAEGFGVSTSGWNNGSPTFTGGIEAKNGKAIWQYLSAHKLTADLIEAGILKSLDGNTEFDLDKGMVKSKTSTEDGDVSTTLANGALNLILSQDGVEKAVAAISAQLGITIEQKYEPEPYVFVEPEGWDELSLPEQVEYRMNDMLAYLQKTQLAAVTLRNIATGKNSQINTERLYFGYKDDDGNSHETSYRNDGADVAGPVTAKSFSITVTNDDGTESDIDLLEQKVLWSGEYLMTADETITLTEPVSNQPKGIKLIFGRYRDGAAEDQNFITFTVSKRLVTEKPGKSSNFPMFTSAFGVACCKALYVHDAKIVGSDNNTKSGTGDCGIIYDNSSFALRYVLSD